MPGRLSPAQDLRPTRQGERQGQGGERYQRSAAQPRQPEPGGGTKGKTRCTYWRGCGSTSHSRPADGNASKQLEWHLDKCRPHGSRHAASGAPPSRRSQGTADGFLSSPAQDNANEEAAQAQQEERWHCQWKKRSAMNEEPRVEKNVAMSWMRRKSAIQGQSAGPHLERNLRSWHLRWRVECCGYCLLLTVGWRLLVKY